MAKILDFEKPEDRAERKKRELYEKRERLEALAKIINVKYLEGAGVDEDLLLRTITDENVKGLCEKLGFSAPPPPTGRDTSQWEELVEKIDGEIRKLE